MQHGQQKTSIRLASYLREAMEEKNSTSNQVQLNTEASSIRVIEFGWEYEQCQGYDGTCGKS
jgi:hypothetical protein